jgi:hypothetical protein
MGPVGLHGLAAGGALARGDDLDDAIALEPLDPDQPLAFEPLHHDRPHRARIVATQHLDIDVAGAGLAVARGLFQRAVVRSVQVSPARFTRGIRGEAADGVSGHAASDRESVIGRSPNLS